MITQIKNRELFIQKSLINGKWCEADDGKLLEVINPATQEVIGSVPHMGDDETKKAIDAAYNAFAKWKEKTAEDRANLLMKWHDLIVENLEDLAVILTIEQGKPLFESRNEINYSASFIKWFAQEARRIYGAIIPSHIKNARNIVTKEPVGVCGMITPWNFPSSMIARKVGPALSAGCTAVIKPASATPFSALALAKLAMEAGIPEGVINVVTGDANEIGRELSTNKLVRKLSFTGSTVVGKLLMAQCSTTVKKLSMELGGNAPLIIFDDANLDNAVKGVINSKFRNSGQTCICANRILVQKNIHDEFLNKLKSEVAKLKVGNGLEESVTQGPLINKNALNNCNDLIFDATSQGAQILLGGKVHNLGKSFFEPTIICDVTTKMKFQHNEIFGPIAPIFKFDDEDQAIEIANETAFGLASYIYSEDQKKAWRVAEKLEYGMVGINEVAISSAVIPFGGVKESGIGREGSFLGIDEYLQIKYILMA